MSTRVLLQIGERSFQTTKETLADGSEYFQQLFSTTWKKVSLDDPIYVDADPDGFAHVLRYLRHAIFPLIYDEAKGHDYAMYGLILEEAKMFGVDALVKWLEGKQYHEAMKTDYFRTSGGEKNALIKVDSSIAVLRPAKDLCVEYRGIWHCARNCESHFDNEDLCYNECSVHGILKLDENLEASSSEEEYTRPNCRMRPAIQHTDLLETKNYNHAVCLDRPSRKAKHYKEKDAGKRQRLKTRPRDPFKILPKALEQPAFPAKRPPGDPLRHWWYDRRVLWDISKRGPVPYSDWSDGDGEMPPEGERDKSSDADGEMSSDEDEEMP